MMEFNIAVLDSMQHLRRRLREEQQVDSRLSQPDAIQAMPAACLCPGDETTRVLIKQLAIYSDMPPPVVTKASLPESRGRHDPFRAYLPRSACPDLNHQSTSHCLTERVSCRVSSASNSPPLRQWCQ